MSKSPVPEARAQLPARTSARIALALGGGGARGFAHILVLEAFDELGIKPAVMSGTSIGAIFGAAYASGLSAKYIRAHTEEVLGQRVDLARHLFASRAEAQSRWFNLVPIRAAILNPESLLAALLPSKLAVDFASLQIPLAVVATDFWAQEQFVLTQGPLNRAVAASMALPAIFTPVMVEGRALVDGGLVNPLPFDLLIGAADLTVAIDVSGQRASETPPVRPSALEVLTASSQIFQRSIVREKLKAMKPDLYIDCPVSQFSVLDFHRYTEIMTAAASIKDQFKRQLGRMIESEPIEPESLPRTALGKIGAAPADDAPLAPPAAADDATSRRGKRPRLGRRRR